MPVWTPGLAWILSFLPEVLYAAICLLKPNIYLLDQLLQGLLPAHPVLVVSCACYLEL